MTSGSAMKGPTPIISSMLKATAERRPMRRCRVSAEVAEVNVMRHFRSPDCTLTGSMFLTQRAFRAVVLAAFAGLAGAVALSLVAQQTAQQPTPQSNEQMLVALPEASEIALPLPEDRGAAALEQSLRRLGTTASLMIIVAQPDDEDGALLTYLSRGLGARATLMTDR